MDFTQAVRKGVLAVSALHSKRQQAAEDKYHRDIATAKTKLEKEKARLRLQREKLRVERELASAAASVKREQAAVSAERGKLGSRGGSIGASVKSGWKSLEKFYGYGPETKKKRTTRRKTTIRKKS